MGNQVCCEDLREEINPMDSLQRVVLTKEHLQRGRDVPTVTQNHQNQQAVHEQPIESPVQKISLPEIGHKVRSTLENQLFFAKELEGIKPIIKQYRGDVYEGELDEEGLLPHGWGRMYKSDGSYFVGEFVQGKAEGRGAFVFPDGSYYLGEFTNNAANCLKGYFESASFKYKGGFKDNTFEGYGLEEGPNCSFQGEYSRGKRAKGTLKWTANDSTFMYMGEFNDKEQYHGHGTLEEELGRYQGDFVDGLKEGKGEYVGKNGVSYKGDYRAGKKDGFGTIFNHNNTIAYKGEFKNGLPHGKGSSFVGGKEIMAIWHEGIDTRMIDASCAE